MTFPFPPDALPAAPRRRSRRRLALAAGGRDRAAAQDKDPVVAKVNGVEIHQSDLAVAEEEAGQMPPMTPDAKKDYLVAVHGRHDPGVEGGRGQEARRQRRLQAQDSRSTATSC